MAKSLKHPGMTLLETIVSLTIVMIMAIASLMLLTQASQTYTKSKAMQESIGRIRDHVPLLLNQIRGTQTIYTTKFPSVGIRFTYYDQNGDLACGRLKWDSSTKIVTFYENPDNTNDCSAPWNKRTDFLTNVDRLQFDTYSPGILKLDYDVGGTTNCPGSDETGDPCMPSSDADPTTGLRVFMHTYTYKLMYTPQLPLGE